MKAKKLKKRPLKKINSKELKLIKWSQENIETAMPPFDTPVRGWWSNKWRLD